jgi:hypothetical protein
MIVVMQCAARKRPDAGHLLTVTGKPVIFVAEPLGAPADPGHEYAQPDNLSATGVSWRQMLLQYNEEPRDNPLGLCRAWRLYENKAYGRLVDRFGVEKVYILSAGCGLIRGNFLTPYSDITFSQSADSYKRRRKSDRCQDCRMLPDASGENVVLVGGKDYVPLFCALTEEVEGQRTGFHNSARAPRAPGCALERFATTTRTNWHYECANALVDRVRW